MQVYNAARVSPLTEAIKKQQTPKAKQNKQVTKDLFVKNAASHPFMGRLTNGK